MKNIQPTIDTGAMTLVLLVKNYRSQMIALLLKNGVTVPNGASSQQIATLMANLLKVSKSFYIDLSNFLKSPKVIQTLAGGLTESAQYFRASGGNFAGQREGNAQYFRFTSTDDDTESTDKPEKAGFFGGLNFGDLFNKALDGFGKYDTNQTNRAIADARARAGLPPQTQEEIEDDNKSNTGSGSGGGKDKDPDTKISTTLIVVLSLVGVAVLGTIIYFVARPKE
jgi:hypothetical protein